VVDKEVTNLNNRAFIGVILQCLCTGVALNRELQCNPSATPVQPLPHNNYSAAECDILIPTIPIITIHVNKKTSRVNGRKKTKKIIR
jgi:hypothetical protein